MTSTETQIKSIGWIVAAAAAAAIFTLDLITPLGYAVPLLHGIPLLITWFGVGVRHTFFMTGGTILLTWVGAALSPGEVSADVVANRIMVSGLLLMIGWLVINRKRLAEQRDADQASLRESEERYALVVAGAEAAIWDWNLPEKRVFFSPRWKALRGLAEDEVSDHETEWSSRIHPDDTERVMAAVRAHFEGRTAVFSEEYRIHHVDGRWIWILDHGVAKRDRAGKVVRMAGSESDITKRKQAEDKMRRTATDLAEAQRVAKLGSWRFDVATDRITLSDQMCTMFEVEPSPLGETYEAFLALVHPDDRPGVVQANVEARLRGTSFDVEFRIMTRDGSVKTMRELGYASRDEGDQVVGLFGTVQDITERKRVETALRESEDRLLLALESANMGTWEWDAETDVLQWNHWQFTLFGVRPGSSPWTGAEALSRIHADDRAGVAAAVRSVMEEGVTVGGEFRVVHADGSVRWLFGSGRPVQDERGRVRHAVGVCLDITERRLAQEGMQSLNESLEVRVRERTAALVEANERWDWVVRATNDGVWDWDLLHDTLYHSPRWREMHGFSESDRTESTKEWLARIHPEDRDQVQDAFVRCRTDQGAQLYQEYRIRRRDGRYFWVLDRGITIFGHEGRAIRMVGAETDITALKSSEALLRQREAQLHDLGVRLLRAQEEERRRISRDLHDDVMQRMGALTLELYGLAASTPSQDTSVSSQLKMFGAAAEQLTTDLQRMAHQLHPSVLEFGGLEMAMREHVNEFAARTGLSVELMTRDIPKEIPLDQATCLYRVLQEALQNVQKHAEATAVLVRLLRTDRGLGLCIHDDGRGIEHFDGSARRTGLGVTSMMERVGMLGGTFRLRTKPNDGTEIHAWLPLEDMKAEA